MQTTDQPRSSPELLLGAAPPLGDQNCLVTILTRSNQNFFAWPTGALGERVGVIPANQRLYYIKTTAPRVSVQLIFLCKSGDIQSYTVYIFRMVCTERTPGALNCSQKAMTS